MAKQNPGQPRDTGDNAQDDTIRPSQGDRDGTRDAIIHEHPRRRREEPAAASMTTDAETGDPDPPEKARSRETPTAEAPEEPGRSEGPVPRTEPAKTYLVSPGESTRETVPRSEHDVRAGPGDAGGTHSPDVTPEPAKSPRTRGGQSLMWIGLGLAVLILLVWLF